MTSGEAPIRNSEGTLELDRAKPWLLARGTWLQSTRACLQSTRGKLYLPAVTQSGQSRQAGPAYGGELTTHKYISASCPPPMACCLFPPLFFATAPHLASCVPAPIRPLVLLTMSFRPAMELAPSAAHPAAVRQPLAPCPAWLFPDPMLPPPGPTPAHEGSAVNYTVLDPTGAAGANATVPVFAAARRLPMPNPLYVCPRLGCGRRFSYEAGLKRHRVRTATPPSRVLLCPCS